MAQQSGHYKKEKIECIDVIEQQDYNRNLMQVQKYIWRNGKKDGNTSGEDLYKAIDYLCRDLYGVWFHELKDVKAKKEN